MVVTCLVLMGLSGVVAQSCDYLTGTVTLSTSGGNMTDTYTTSYVLTSLNGSILAIGDSPSFDILQEGLYTAYAVNFRDDLAPTGLAVGDNINNVTSDCTDVGSPHTFTVCENIDNCNHCLGQSVVLESSGGNTSSDFTTVYAVTNSSGEILAITVEPVFDGLGQGLYTAVAINYETSKGIEGLVVGENIADIASTCYDVGNAYVFGICDQLSPSIFFDLKGCDITQTAILLVAEQYDSYIWSTGSTRDEITVSATTPATYRVTVMLENGCIGIVEQRITGEEISRIGDFVWEDINADGRQDANEPGLNGVEINLYSDFDRNGRPDNVDFPACTTTSRNHPTTGEPGYYEFTVYQSNYVIEFVKPEGYAATEPNMGDDVGDSDANQETGFTSSIAAGPNETITNIDAGFRTSAGVGGSVWEDSDADGRRDGNEMGLNGVTINLYSTDGMLVASQLTDSIPGSNFDGAYCFEGIAVQDYYVEIVLPDGSVLSEANVGSNDALDSEGTNANGPGTTDNVSTSPGMKTEGIDFGLYFGGRVCGIVWTDDPMGTEGIYEAGIDSVVVNSEVYLIDEESRDTTLISNTGADGRYCLDAVPVGSYRVAFGANPVASSFVPQNVGNDPLVDSDVNTTTSRTEVFFVGSQDTINGVNAGLRMGVVAVTLTRFSGYWDKKKDANVLDWVTAGEINNDRFEVERLVGFDGFFEVVGSVSGQGSTNEVTTYNFEDTDIDKSASYYYRLRQVDYDGGSEYSDIIAINVSRLKSSGRSTSRDFLKIFPNPASDQVQVMLLSDDDTTIEIQLSDLTGRSVVNWKNIALNKGENLISLKLEDVMTGSYLLQFIDGERIGQQLLQIAR